MSAHYDSQTTADVLVQDLASEIAGKVILTTGASPGGLGAFFNTFIAPAKPKLLILAGRNLGKMHETAEALSKDHPDVQTRPLELDLESLEKVREAAATVNSWSDVPRIDVLVNNAGIMACEYAKTVDGFERQFATSHVGPFVFTNLIINKILESKSPRVVNVSSNGHRLSAIRWPDVGFSDGRLYNKWRAYGQGKTANILFAVALGIKYGSKGLTAVSLHPGVISTNLSKHLNWENEYAGMQNIDKELGNVEGWAKDFQFKDPAHGVATHVFAAFDPSLKALIGPYVEDSHVADPYVDTIKPYAKDRVEADKLWKLSEELVGQSFA